MSAEYVITAQPIAVPKPVAAQLLGMSVDSFERHAQADLKVIRRGRLRLYPVSDLQRWATDAAERIFKEEAA